VTEERPEHDHVEGHEEQQDPATPTPDPAVELPPPTETHAEDGLDLARSAARAAARTPGRQAPRKKVRSPGAVRRRGRSGFSGAHPDDRDPQLLGDSLDRLVAAAGWGLDLRVQGVFGRWAELVGQEVAEHCTPESLNDGRLQVRTSSTAWATQLRLLAPTIVRRLNEELGHGTVTVIDVNGPHLPTWRKGPRSARDGRGPRDTYG
jgi:predicted nucleic acid-binding Zn ribbon protein